MTSNIFQNALIGFQAGQDMRDRRDRRNALARWQADPEGAIQGLTALGDFEGINALNALSDRREARDTRAQVAPLISGGDFQGAARTAAAAGQTDLAGQLMSMSASELAQARERGQRGASILFAALELPPEQRGQFVAGYRDEAIGAGIDPQTFDSFDWSNDTAIRAAGAAWLDAADLAGRVESQRVGDNIEVVRSTPFRQEVLDRREIPMTRDEQFQREQFGYQQGRDQTEDQFRQQALDIQRNPPPNSTGDVLGPLLARYASGQALSEPEQRIVDRYLEGGNTDDMLMQLLGGGAGGQPPATGARPSGGQGALGSQGNPARPTSEAEFDALPAGAWFVNPADGRLLQKER